MTAQWHAIRYVYVNNLSDFSKKIYSIKHILRNTYLKYELTCRCKLINHLTGAGMNTNTSQMPVSTGTSQVV